MNNKKQITLLVSVPVTVTYDEKCGLDEEQISQEIQQETKRVLMDEAEYFLDDQDGTYVIVNEISVLVNDIIPTAYGFPDH